MSHASCIVNEECPSFLARAQCAVTRGFLVGQACSAFSRMPEKKRQGRFSHPPADKKCVDIEILNQERKKKGPLRKAFRKPSFPSVQRAERLFSVLKGFVNSLPTSKCTKHTQRHRGLIHHLLGSCTHVGRAVLSPVRKRGGRQSTGPQRCLRAWLWEHILLHLGRGPHL